MKILEINLRNRIVLIRILTIVSILGGFLVSCHSTSLTSNETFRDSIPTINFCDLPKYTGKQVYLKAYYSGIDEYWSLTDPRKQNCNPALTVDLQFTGTNPYMTPKEFENVFLKVTNNYQNSYLLLELIGKFENDRKEGYGHLGHNNSRFVVTEIIKATLKKKRTRD